MNPQTVNRKPATVNRLLLIEPYYGGSHRVFLDDLVHHLGDFEFTSLTQPARNWKWRMRFAAPWCAAQLPAKRHVDAILCSTFIDVAALRGLGPSWLAEVPIFIYFHENQFAYPVQQGDQRDYHFGLTNYLSALAVDGLAFNSCYNRDTFLAGCRTIEKKAPDFPMRLHEDLSVKSRVLHPPLDFQLLDIVPDPTPQSVPVIVWNHRWEYDKNPEAFFKALFILADEGLNFKLIVLGQSFGRLPTIFAQAQERLAAQIIHFGYAPDRQHYFQLLKQGSIVVSTANHEFFGMAVIEAVRAGCRPLLPKRLSYPELFPAEFLYEDDDSLLTVLRRFLAQPHNRLSSESRQHLTNDFSWPALAPSYDLWLRSASK